MVLNCTHPALQPQCICKCQPCNPNNDQCCSGLRCMPAGYKWRGPTNWVCLEARYSYRASTRSALDGAALPAETAQCAAVGEMCGRAPGGRQCCGPQVDCVVGNSLVGYCKPREETKAEGSDCTGIGQCGSGLVCKGKKCVAATCDTPSKCQPNNYLCRFEHQLSCEVYYAAASSSVQ